ncbi:MAG: Rdx family protein, partial [Bdellovibrionota bacterium]
MRKIFFCFSTIKSSPNPCWTVPKPSIRITYCTQCSWMLRAAWMAQELLSTFGNGLGAV